MLNLTPLLSSLDMNAQGEKSEECQKGNKKE